MTKDEALTLEAYAEGYRSGFDNGHALGFTEGSDMTLAQPAQEPVFKWHSVFQEMPVENSHLLFCFGVHVVEGSYTKNGWASLSYGSAQPDFWAYFPPPPHHRRNQELYAMPPQRPWVDEEAVRADEREKFCAVLRQLHDSYALTSSNKGFDPRGNT